MNDILKFWPLITAIIAGFGYLLVLTFQVSRKFAELEIRIAQSIDEKRATEIARHEVGQLKADLKELNTTIHAVVREFDQKAYELAIQLAHDKRGAE